MSIKENLGWLLFCLVGGIVLVLAFIIQPVWRLMDGLNYPRIDNRKE